MKTKNKFLFWISFLSLLCLAILFQIHFGQRGIKYVIMPYIFLPVCIFFFLHNKTLPSIGLCLFMGAFSSTFSSLSAPSLILIFLLLFSLILSIKKIFFYKSTLLFFALVTLFAYFLPFLPRLIYEFPQSPFFLPKEIPFFRILMTLFVSFLLFPFFKTYLQKEENF